MSLFIIKIAAGLAYGYISQHFYANGSDAWALNYYGNEEYSLMLSKPKEFLMSIFKPNEGEYFGNFFGSTASFWNSLKNNILIKIIAILNIFSKGNYYINSLFFNFFCFFGHIALYRVFLDLYPKCKRIVLLGCFLLPSTLYFSSGLNKDCVVFALLGAFSYYLYFSLKNHFTLKRISIIFFTSIGILLVRNYVIAALLPAAIALIICSRYKTNILKTYFSTYMLLGFLVFLIILLQPVLNPIQIISQKQQDFFKLPVATSQMQTDTLTGGALNFILTAPMAINHAFVRPYIGEFSSVFYSLASAEVLFYLVLFLVMLIYYKSTGAYNPFVVFGILSAVMLFIFIGYIVPNAGSLIRYRSIYLPLIIIPVWCSIDKIKILNLLNINSKNI
ncbi:MAG: hypothetical protein ABIT07_00695 [Ferruginibacter sp.]